MPENLLFGHYMYCPIRWSQCHHTSSLTKLRIAHQHYIVHMHKLNINVVASGALTHDIKHFFVGSIDSWYQTPFCLFYGGDCMKIQCDVDGLWNLCIYLLFIGQINFEDLISDLRAQWRVYTCNSILFSLNDSQHYGKPQTKLLYGTISSRCKTPHMIY